MEKKTFLGIWILMLLTIASTVFALNVDYINPDTGNVLTQAQVDNITTSPLPGTLLTIDLSQDSFSVDIPSLNISEFNPINVSFRNLSNENVSNATHNLGNSTYRYVVKDSYAFNIFNSSNFNKTFTVQFNYSGLSVGDENDLILYKADFNFTTNKTDFSTLVDTGATIDTTNDLVTFTTTSFSVFILAEDTYVAPSQPSSGGGTSSSRGPAPGGGYFVVNCSNGLKDIGEKGVDCGPICGNTCPEENVTEEAEAPAPTVPTPPREEAPAIIPTELISPVEGVEKPIDIWTLILGITFIVVLIGGISIFRHFHVTEKIPMPGEKVPPLRPSIGIPSEEVQIEPKVGEQSLLEKPFDAGKEIREVKEIEGEKPREPETIISPDAMQNLVNYIHLEEDKHFNKEMIVKALLVKNWPQRAIEDAFRIVDSMKQSISDSTIKKLHKYIMKEFGKGFSEERIRKELLKKEWPDFIVNEAFNQLRELENDLKEVGLHAPNYDLNKGKEGIKNLMNKGYNRKKIESALSLAGWPSDAISTLFR